MKLTCRDYDQEFEAEFARRPRKGGKFTHGGEQFIVQDSVMEEGREIWEVRGPRSMDAAIAGMAEIAKAQDQS